MESARVAPAVAVAALVLGGCGTPNAGSSGQAPHAVSSALCEPSPTDPGVEPQEKADRLKPSRLLRRASLALRGVPPTDDELAAQEGAGDEAAQLAYVDAFVDQALGNPLF